MRKKIIIAISISVVFIFFAYFLSKRVTYMSNRVEDYVSSKADSSKYKITNINIYRNTPVWELALAVEDQRQSAIEKIAKNNPELLNYQDPKYGATLLLWAVGMEKYESCETLLKCGVDPNIASIPEGETPLFNAAGFSWIDNKAKNDPKYVKLLLSYGADPNKTYVGKKNGITEQGASPLMNSIGCGIEKTKALVEGGTDINLKTKSGETASTEALLTDQYLEYAHYLIVERKAKVTDPTYRKESLADEDPNEKFFPVTRLRNWTFKIDSEQYKLKMDIVEEFSRQGVNYWDTKITSKNLEHIKKLYPDTWEDYIKKY